LRGFADFAGPAFRDWLGILGRADILNYQSLRMCFILSFPMREGKPMKLFATFVFAALLPFAALAEGVAHRLAIHVDENDPAVMNMALNNAQNATAYYASVGDTVEIELVAYGPGLMMFVADKSPVVDRLSAMSLEMPTMTFSACGNTLAAMKKKAGGDVALVSEAVVVPSGVVRLIELQEQGFAYLRP